MDDKNWVLIIGAGKSGISAAHLLINSNFKIIIYDENTNLDTAKIKKDLSYNDNVQIFLGNIDDEILEHIKMCVISPGFPKYKEIVIKIKSLNIPIVSEIELGYMFCKGLICAVTGTNGKTTTVNLIYQILNKHYKKVFLAGNVGTPFCDIVKQTDEESIVVLEISSFQLEDINKFKPNVAAILNLSPDHLDRYDHYLDYVNTKINIAANQTGSDYLILNYEDNILKELSKNNNLFKSRIVFFSSKSKLIEGFYLQNDSFFYKKNTKNIKLLDVSDLKLIGDHNYDNVMAAIAVSYYMGVSFPEIVEVCKNFDPIEHRLEFVREKSGIKFYNDSKATNPDAAIKAIDSIKSRIILIAGGHDKGVDYGDFILKVKEKVKYMILIGEAKKIIGQKCHNMNYNNVVYADSLNEAVEIAYGYANVSDTILLSPACSSFDMFKNYEERGNEFKKIVMSLK